MNYLAYILYSILIITYVVTFFFILYHLVKYSINPTLNALIIPFFSVISVLLLISNIILFSLINWQSLFRNIPGFSM